MQSQVNELSEQELENIPLKERIARLCYILALETNRTSTVGDKLTRIGISINLLNQASMIVDSNSQLALRLYNQARSTARKG